MAMDLEAVKVGLRATVPMVATLSLEFVDLTTTTAVMRLPDREEYHNHLTGPHAGAMFTLGESASGALVLANFGGPTRGMHTVGGRSHDSLPEAGDGTGAGDRADDS